MSIGQIVIGGGVDTSPFSNAEELIFINSPVAKTVVMSSFIERTHSMDSAIERERALNSTVMVVTA